MENAWTTEIGRLWEENEMLKEENRALREAARSLLPVLMADAGSMPVSGYVIALNQKIARLRALAGEGKGE